MAHEYAADGVTINAVAPGYMDTELTRQYLADHPGRREALIELIPAGRFARSRRGRRPGPVSVLPAGKLHHRDGPVHRRRTECAVSGKLEGKTVMVTGAGTGFGQQLAIKAAQEGAARVIVHYRSSAAGAEQTADGVRAAGADADLIQGDISSWDEIKRMAHEAGDVDALVNNVGDMASSQTSWSEPDEATIDHVLAVDIKGTMLMVHEFGTRMLERRTRGAIVNIGSTVIVRGSPRAPIYAAGKYGLLGITKSYAKALAPHVRVNTFAPGFMDTPAVMNRPDMRSGRLEQLTRDTPMGRIPPPEELTAAALFLATDDASHITGSYMICDGGYSMLGA